MSDVNQGLWPSLFSGDFSGDGDVVPVRNAKRHNYSIVLPKQHILFRIKREHVVERFISYKRLIVFEKMTGQGEKLSIWRKLDHGLSQLGQISAYDKSEVMAEWVNALETLQVS